MLNKNKFSGITRQVKKEDLEVIKSILEFWFVDIETKEPIEEEIDKILDTIKNSIVKNDTTKYLVAEENGQVLGIMGLRPLTDERMKSFAQTENPVEFFNAYIDPKHRNRGVGKALLEARKKLAKNLGYTEALLNSGPRYKETGWGFHNKMYGPHVGIVPDCYGKGIDAPVWRKLL